MSDNQQTQPTNVYLSAPTTMSPLTNVSSVGRGSGAADEPTAKRQLFADSGMYEDEIENIEKKLVEMIVNCEMPFSCVESQSFRDFVDCLWPLSSEHIPDRERFEVLFYELFEGAMNSMLSDMKEKFDHGHHFGLMVDGRMNMAKAKVHLDRVIAKVGDDLFPLKYERADFENHGLAIARGWESILQTIGKEQKSNLSSSFAFRYFLSDDIGQCGHARRILALRHPSILWMRCWAHQINLMVNQLLQNTQFKEVAKRAIDAAYNITSSSSKWQSLLQNETDELYGKNAASKVHTIAATRWNSLQQCFASQLRIRDACKNFVDRYGQSSSFPDSCRVWGDTGFWVNLEEAEMLIRPFSDASYLMQRNEQNTIAHVVLVLMSLVRHIHVYGGDNELTAAAAKDIEHRWSNEENPLFFLAFALHPSFRHIAVAIIERSTKVHGNWLRNKNALTSFRLCQAASFYYGKYKLFYSPASDAAARQEELDYLEKSLVLWLSDNKKLVGMFRYRAGRNEAAYFIFTSREHKELCRLAAFLLDCPVQSAECELLFKDFGPYRTKPHIRSNWETFYKHTIVKRDIQKRHEDEAKSDDSKRKRPNVVLAKKMSTNCILKAAQYKHINVPPSSPFSGEERQVEKNTIDQEQLDLDVALIEEEDELQEDSEKGDGDCIEIWLHALKGVASDDNQDNFYRLSMSDAMDEDNEDDGQKSTVTERADEKCVVEDGYEVAPSELLPLPVHNVENYPQEDTNYFKKKNYVRCDKYTLASMVLVDDLGVEIPSLESIYKMHCRH